MTHPLTRRTLLTWGVAVAGGLLVPGRAARRYGAVTVEQHTALCRQGIHLRVFHLDQDVTNRCFFADDTGLGRADLFLQNAAGQWYWDPRTHEAAQETVYGVTFREGAPFK